MEKRNRSKIKKYKFRRYKFYYPLIFKREKKKLQRIFGRNFQIEHVGSTAIKGLGGKGIVDIQVSVPKKQLEYFKNLLIKKKYVLHPNKKRGDRLYFVKDNSYINKIHIHLTRKGSVIEKDTLAFVNYLRKNKKHRKRYSEIKKQGIKIAKGESKKYKEYKKKIIKEILKEIKK